MDVVRLETSMRGANIQKQHFIAVVFQLKEGIKTTWKYGKMKDLHNLKL